MSIINQLLILFFAVGFINFLVVPCMVKTRYGDTAGFFVIAIDRFLQNGWLTFGWLGIMKLLGAGELDPIVGLIMFIPALIMYFVSQRYIKGIKK